MLGWRGLPGSTGPAALPSGSLPLRPFKSRPREFSDCPRPGPLEGWCEITTPFPPQRPPWPGREAGKSAGPEGGPSQRRPGPGGPVPSARALGHTGCSVCSECVSGSGDSRPPGAAVGRSGCPAQAELPASAAAPPQPGGSWRRELRRQGEERMEGAAAARPRSPTSWPGRPCPSRNSTAHCLPSSLGSCGHVPAALSLWAARPPAHASRALTSPAPDQLLSLLFSLPCSKGDSSSFRTAENSSSHGKWRPQAVYSLA